MDLKNINLLELQSRYMQEDKTTEAICGAINSKLISLSETLELCIIYSRIDELEDKILDELAWQFNVDFYDVSLNINKKRELIKNAIRWHKIKGTPAAVIEVATSVFGRTKLKEWFQYGGQPYYFKLDIDITEQGASSENLRKLDRLINKYKNTRSWLEKITISLANNGSIFYGATTIGGEEIIVYPWAPKNVESKGKVTVAVGHNVCFESVQVYPKKEMI